VEVTGFEMLLEGSVQWTIPEGRNSGLLVGIFELARLHVEESAVLSVLGIKVDTDASANLFLNVWRRSASLLSSAGAAEATMGLKAAKNASGSPRYIVEDSGGVCKMQSCAAMLECIWSALFVWPCKNLKQ
jgi:hypothetical protein